MSQKFVPISASSFSSYFTRSRFRILVVFGDFLLALAFLTRLTLLTAQ